MGQETTISLHSYQCPRCKKDRELDYAPAQYRALTGRSVSCCGTYSRWTGKRDVTQEEYRQWRKD